MIEKRPLFFAVVCLVLGEVCGRCEVEIKVCMPLLFLCGLFLFYRRNRWKFRGIEKAKRNRRNRQRIVTVWLSIFLLFYLAGYCHNLWFEQHFLLHFQEDEEREVVGYGKIIEKNKNQYGISYRCKKPTLCYKTEGKEVVQLYGDVLLYGVDKELLLGETVGFSGKIKEIEEPTNPGEFNKKRYQLARGIVGIVQKTKVWYHNENQYDRFAEGIWKLREKLNEGYEQAVPEVYSGVCMAMVTGEKSKLDPKIKKLYQRQGIAHILAISGLHIAFIGRNFFNIVRKWNLSYISSGICSFGLLITYSLMVGQGASVMRATLMLCLLIFGEIIGRSYDMITAMGVSACISILENPYCIMDTGFLLSYGAIVGIGMCYPYYFGANKDKGVRETEKLHKKTGVLEEVREHIIHKNLKEGFLISLSVQMVTLPILLYCFYGFSPYSVVLNLVVIPLMSILLPCAMAGGGMTLLSIEWGKILLYPCMWILDCYEFACTSMEYIPFSFWVTGAPPPRFYLIYYSMLVALPFLWRKKGARIGIFSLLLSIFMVTVDVVSEVESLFYGENSSQIKREKALNIIGIDVGQGDGLLFQLPNGTKYLLDGGSTSVGDIGENLLLPLLYYYGITTLDGAIVTHMDRDHYNGMKQLFGQIKIKRLYMPRLERRDQEYDQLVALAKYYGTEVFYQMEGDYLKEGEIEFRWISPAKERQKEDKNDNSQVFFLRYGKFSALFTGDMGEEREKEIVEYLEPCTLLKVGHHGSKYSSNSLFLERLKPKYAVISYGKGNRYGHPSKETMERLENIHAISYETGKQGAIFIETDGTRIKMKGYKK